MAHQSHRERSIAALHTTVRADGVALVLMDVPGESTNTLQAGFADEFARVFEELASRPSVRAVVLGSAKRDNFIAGADIRMLEAVKSTAEGEALSREGQRAMDALEAFEKPVVAAIHGACLGGGLEVALACHGRVASSHRKTKLGLPECQLGLLPGAGGTQRLPRLIGIRAALDLLLTGKSIDARRAKKLGLVDEVVDPAIVLDAACAAALRLVETRGKSPARAGAAWPDIVLDKDALTEYALAGNPLGRKIVFDRARKALHAKTRGNYPAQDAILDVTKAGLDKGIVAGLAAEARAFGALLMTPESVALRSIFFATQALKKDPGTDDTTAAPRPIRKVGVLGGGLMGAGIAYVTADIAKLPVRLKDKDANGVLAGLRYVREIVDKRIKRKRISKAEADELMSQVSGTTDYTGFAGCDIAIEAVFEDLALKQKMVRDIEEHASPNAIFASNTSSLPIARIAEASLHPETVLGMHYFSPVHKMPLLEVVVTEKTASWVTATAVQLGKQQGKTVIVVRDSPGFYTTRILAPFMNEAAYVLAEGVAIERIDEALMDFGFPIGPMKLTDEVGIDVGAKVGGILREAFGARMTPPPGMERLIADDRKGRKNGKGFYKYGHGEKGVDDSVYELLGLEPSNKSMASDDIAWRCTLAMINEAARCLDEGIVRSARDGDIGAIFGLGFPPFRGGPFRCADHEGIAVILQRLKALQHVHGMRFAPAPLLERMAAENLTFHGIPPR